MDTLKSDHGRRPSFYISERLQDFLAFFCLIVVPMTSGSYILAASMLALPESILTVVVIYLLFATFLGVILVVSTRNKRRSRFLSDGVMVVSKDPDGTTIYSLELNEDPEYLKDKRSITFVVVNDLRNSNNAFNETS